MDRTLIYSWYEQNKKRHLPLCALPDRRQPSGGGCAARHLCSGIIQRAALRPGQGAGLDISDAGMLLWEVESLTTMRCSLATSAYAFAGTAWVYQYTFDPAGCLIGQIKTDEAVNFYR